MRPNKAKQQVIILYISTILGVGLGVFVSILNTRSLNPSDYGDVRYINNLIAFFSGILLFGYFTSGSRLLALAKTEEESLSLKGCLIGILLLTIIANTLILTICGLIHNEILHKDYYYLFYIVLPVCGSTILLNYINTTSQGDNSINTIAAARILPQLIYLLIAFIIYQKCGASSESMLLLQNGITVIVLVLLIWRNRFSFQHFKKTFKKLSLENKKYGLQVYYGSLTGVSVQYIAGISLGLFATNNTEVGYYSLALTITAPLIMLPNVIGTTYFKQFAHQSSIPAKVLQWTITISVISLIGFIVLIYPLVDFLYNDSYKDVSLYASALAIGCSIHGIGDMFNRFLGAHGKGVYLRNSAWVCGLVAMVGYTYGIYLWGIYGAIGTRILSSTSYCILLIIYYHKFSSSPQ